MNDIWKTETLRIGDLELIILPGIGGRLWDIVFYGRSLLFQNKDLQGFIPNINQLQGFPTRSPQFGFPLWGGEKTWIAPDRNWPNAAPFVALDSGPYSAIEFSAEHITLRSAICPFSGLEIEREIRLTGTSTWTIQHRVKNRGSSEKEVGIWSVMMVNHSAQIGVHGHDLKPTHVFGLPNDFVTTCDKCIICDCSKTAEFKVAIENPDGRTLIRFEKNGPPIWMSCDTQRPNPHDQFAHSYPLEIFNSNDYPYCEAEWHAPMKTLAANGTAEFSQHFTVWNDTGKYEPKQTDLELMKCMS